MFSPRAGGNGAGGWGSGGVQQQEVGRCFRTGGDFQGRGRGRVGCEGIGPEALELRQGRGGASKNLLRPFFLLSWSWGASSGWLSSPGKAGAIVGVVGTAGALSLGCLVVSEELVREPPS